MSGAAEFVGRRFLCLDCLRVRDADHRRGDGRCVVCGGELCDCRSCAFLICELEAGNFKPIGVVGELATWTAEAGGTFSDREGIA